MDSISDGLLNDLARFREGKPLGEPLGNAARTDFGELSRAEPRPPRITKHHLDELAAAAVRSAGRLEVLAAPIARPETSQGRGKGMAHLAATLIVAGAWAHRARFRGATSRRARAPRYRKHSE
jgi:hypothetical protein